MAQGNDDDRNEVVSSQSLTPELPTLCFDLIAEILCRLPVKLLIQLRCLCKFFNSLLSDPKFAKKHLQLSTKRHHLMLFNRLDGFAMYDSPIPSVFPTSTVFTQTQLYHHIITIGRNFVNVMRSCDGIFCGMLDVCYYFVWNPSIRKFKLLPPLENSLGHIFQLSFGYDHFIHNYKVIIDTSRNEVFVYTLGTDHWTTIEDIPDDYSICGSGIFVSGAVNWYAEDESDSLYFILSLDLENESYQELYLPDFENESYLYRKLGVLRDCLCVFETSEMFLNVWIMNEYGNEESWTKLFHVPKVHDHQGLKAYKPLYIFEDEKLLVEFFDVESCDRKFVVYDSKTATFNILEFQNNYAQMNPKVYIESLISP